MRVLPGLLTLLAAWPGLAADIHVTPAGARDFTAGLSLSASDTDHLRRQLLAEGRYHLITITGEFRAGDDRILTRALLEAEGPAVVLFESPGGSLMAGLAMGRAIRIQGALTAVDSAATCASACGLAWLGGARRLMTDTARVGFHAAYYIDDQGNAIETGQGNALIGAYLNQLGLSDPAVMYITGAAPADMTWLSPQDADEMGIPVRLVQTATATPKLTPPEQLFQRPAPPPQVSQPTAPAQDPRHVLPNVSEGYVNARRGPGTMHGILFRIPAGSRGLEVGDCVPADKGGGRYPWCIVRWQGQTGWVSQSGIRPG